MISAGRRGLRRVVAGGLAAALLIVPAPGRAANEIRHAGDALQLAQQAAQRRPALFLGHPRVGLGRVGQFTREFDPRDAV